jgi:hypothetical protein
LLPLPLLLLPPITLVLVDGVDASKVATVTATRASVFASGELFFQVSEKKKKKTKTEKKNNTNAHDKRRGGPQSESFDKCGAHFVRGSRTADFERIAERAKVRLAHDDKLLVRWRFHLGNGWSLGNKVVVEAVDVDHVVCVAHLVRHDGRLGLVVAVDVGNDEFQLITHCTQIQIRKFIFVVVADSHLRVVVVVARQ